MQIDGDVQCLGPFPDDPVFPFVQVLPVGMTLDHGPFEPQYLDGPFQFVGRRFGVLGRALAGEPRALFK